MSVYVILCVWSCINKCAVKSLLLVGIQFCGLGNLDIFMDRYISLEAIYLYPLIETCNY